MTVFNCVGPHVQRVDELRRGWFRFCQRGSWNLAAIHRARLEHKRPVKEGLAFRLSLSSQEERMASPGRDGVHVDQRGSEMLFM